METDLLYFSEKSSHVCCIPEYKFIKSILVDFFPWFEKQGEVIHVDRNIIKVFDKALIDSADDLVAKSFKVPNVISRIIYSFFRQSKAKRSFYNSLKLEAAGFSVPSPVAYVECTDKKLINNSYFISKKIDSDCTLHEVYRQQMFDWNEVLPHVVEQAYLMHQSGMLHRDFSHGNILVKKKGDVFSFSFVDLNRLYKGNVGFESGLKSLVRLANDEESLLVLAKCYAAQAKRDEQEAIAVLRNCLSRHQSQKRLKQVFKNLLGIKRA